MYKYTNGEILYEECFVSQFFKVTEKITPENYRKEVEDGLYKDTEISVTKETQQLKFRYKDPYGQLIEQENVPVVVDGTGIKAITDYWAVSQTDVKPDLSLFTTVLKNPDSVNRYLWKFSVIEYTDGTTKGSYEDAVITGVYGKDGTSAKYVEIDTSEGVAFVNGLPSKITLRAICTGFTPSSYKWFKNGTELTGKTQSYLEVTTEGVYKVNVNGQYEDTQSIVAVKDGEDAYTVVIDNENIHVPTDSNGCIPEEFLYYGTVYVYKGSKKLNSIKPFTELGDNDFYITLSIGMENLNISVLDSNYGKFEILIPRNTYLINGVNFTVNVHIKNISSIVKKGELVPAKAGAKGDKGDEGEQGERGAEYLGCFARNDLAYDSRNGNLVADDFYLNSTDGYIHIVTSVNESAVSWGQVSSYSDTRYKQAMNDMIAIAGSDRSEGFMSVVNLWVKNLTAQTALIQELFSKNVTVESQLTVNKLKATNANIEGEISANTGYLKNLDIKGELSFPLSEYVRDYYNPETDETKYYKAGLNANGTFYIPKIITSRLDVNESGIFSSKVREEENCSDITFSHNVFDPLPEKYLILVDNGYDDVCMIEIFYYYDNWWYKINDMNLTISDDENSKDSFPNHSKNFVKKVYRMDGRQSKQIIFEFTSSYFVRIYGYLKTPYATE